MRRAAFALGLALLAWPGPAPADDQAPSSPATGTQAATAPEPAAASDEDFDVVPAEPDFHVITLPTNLRLPKHRLAFRLTHRFARGLCVFVALRARNSSLAVDSKSSV